MKAVFRNQCHFPPTQVFINPYFQRGCGHLLTQVKRRLVTKTNKTSPVVEEESCSGASGDGWMVGSTSHRHVQTTPSSSPLGSLEAPSPLLAPELAGLALQKPSMLDQLEALIAKVQAQQSPLHEGVSLVFPSLALYILLAALLDRGLPQMDKDTSATTSD